MRLSLVNIKGGTGKTPTAAHPAVELGHAIIGTPLDEFRARELAP